MRTFTHRAKLGFVGLAPALIALSISACGDGSASEPAGEPAVPEAVADAFVDNGEPFISINDLAAAIDAGMELTIIDSRPANDFAFGHIPGAINVPYFEAADHLDSIPRDRWAVAYCECPNSEALQVQDILLQNGYRYVKVVEEGLAPWYNELDRPLAFPEPEARK